MSNNIITSNGYKLHSLNQVKNDINSELWARGKLQLIEDFKNKNVQYEYHATGFADLDGRNYIALPKGTNIKDPKIIEKYNLI